MSAPQAVPHRGIVKQILSGDLIVIRGQPKGGPPPEKQISLSNIKAPKLGKRAIQGSDETKDEPFAWEAREFMRKKLIGKEILFTLDKPTNSTREYGVIYLGKDIASGENINEALVAEGLATVRGSGPDVASLVEAENQAKAAGKGMWNTTVDRSQHVRDIKYSVDNMLNFVDKANGKPFKAIVEHVRDGSTVRCLLLPDFYYVTIMITGIRCPSSKLDADGRPDPSVKVEYADEARYFVESRLLQRDVEVVLESVNNNNFVGSILHPKGNIAEFLVTEGFARCVDWSIAKLKSGAEKLRAAEKLAKEKRLRLWKDYQPNTPQISGKEKEFIGTVMEVINGDALIVKLPNGQTKKIFLASIRPPREQKSGDQNADVIAPPRPKNFRPLYDIPWMYEAREFLRKKLIGKKVNVTVDYKQPAKDNFPEKICCTVTISGVNVAEALVSKGLATVVKHKQDDDQRSSFYDALQAAESKAQKSGKGIYAKKDIPTHRINDYSGDAQKAKQILPHLVRGNRIEALVEFVASGSRLRLYVPKESCLITFLLAGINCQRAPRIAPGGKGSVDGDPYGNEALTFTKEKCLQKEIEITVEASDKAGNFIGWLWVDNYNLSVLLVQEGFASVHSSAERSEHYKTLMNAEESAKARKEKMWKNYKIDDDKEKQEQEDKVIERKLDYQRVLVIEVTPELHVYCQQEEQGAKLENMLAKMRQELAANPPLPGAYSPKRGDLCAAKFKQDGEWYRAKVEKVSGPNVSVVYVDYGNRDEIPATLCGTLPSGFAVDKFYATEYALACVTLPSDPDDHHDSIEALKDDILDRTLLLNVEYRVGNLGHVTLTDENTNEDVVKGLIKDGFLLVEKRREKRLQKLMDEYNAAQDEAKKARLNVWRYGDITMDED